MRSSAWEDIVDVARAYGLILDEWQENVLEAAMGERSDGQWASPRVGVSVPRQNGKGALIEARELAGLLVFGEQSIVHSAHEQKTARVGFDRIKSYFENFDDLRKKVKKIGTAVAREYIELTTGQFLRFPARSNGAIRGFSIDCLILDEAQEFSDYQLQAVMPTMAARPNPQMWLLGTPPTPVNDGDVFTRWRQAGLEGKDHRLTWLEWSAPDDCDLDDRGAWRAANPALGIRIGYETVADERAALDDEGFARERLGIWDSVATRSIIEPEAWEAVADATSRPTSRRAIGVDVSPDQSMASISRAGLRDDGLWHVELWEQRPGTTWIAPYLAELLDKHRDVQALVVDGISPAATLVPELERLRMRPLVTSARDMVAACQSFYAGVYEQTLRHTAQPQLTVSLGAAAKRSVGDGGWAWSRKSSTSDITALVSATLALWGAQQDVKPNKKPLRKPSGRSSKRRGFIG